MKEGTFLQRLIFFHYEGSGGRSMSIGEATKKREKNKEKFSHFGADFAAWTR
jgi:hypothetical protein